jgi:hypothetical protein
VVQGVGPDFKPQYYKKKKKKEEKKEMEIISTGDTYSLGLKDQ